MARLTGDEASEGARVALGLDSSVPAFAWPVDRLDAPGGSYYLVLFGPLEASVAVAAVDAATGDVLTSARLSGSVPHLPLSKQEAAERAGLPTESVTRLVWQPSRQSRSLLYPLWEVRRGSRIAYVDRHGSRWPRLDPAGQGGNNGGNDASR
jgi:hypothetical protein